MEKDASSSGDSLENGQRRITEWEESADKVTTTVQAEELTFTPAQTKKLLRKMDIHLVPFLALLYLYVILMLLVHTTDGQLQSELP